MINKETRFSIPLEMQEKLEEWLKRQGSFNSYRIEKETRELGSMLRVSANFSGSRNEFRQHWNSLGSNFSAENMYMYEKYHEQSSTLCMDEKLDGDLAVTLSNVLNSSAYVVIRRDATYEYPNWWKMLPDRYLPVLSILTPKDGYGCRDEVSVYRVSTTEFIAPLLTALGYDDDGVMFLFWPEEDSDIQVVTQKLFSVHSAFELSVEDQNLCKAFQHYIWGGGSDEYHSEVFIKDGSIKESLLQAPRTLGYKGSYIIF